MTILFLLIDAAAISISNVLGGVAARRLPMPLVLALAGVSSAVVALGFAILTDGRISVTGLCIGFAAGLIGGAALPLAYRAYAIGPVGSAASIIACTSTAILAIVGFTSGEEVTAFRIVGLALCGVAILLVTRRTSSSTGGTHGSTLVFSLLAAIGFSGFVLLIDFAPEADGLWPLTAARGGVMTIAGFMIFFALRPGEIRLAPPSLSSPTTWLAVMAGILDTIASIFLVLAVHSGDLVLVAILAPVAPILTALVGKIFLHEVMSRPQIVGLAVGAGAVVFAAL